MPDGSWVSSDSDTLELCWPLDPKRPDSFTADEVVVGPKFGSIFQSLYDIDNDDTKLWVNFEMAKPDVAEDFTNVYYYARSKLLMSLFLRDYKAKKPSDEDWVYGDGVRRYTAQGLASDVEWAKYGQSGLPPALPGSSSGGGLRPVSYVSRQEWLTPPHIVQGWQFFGVGQDMATNAEDAVIVTYYRDPTLRDNSTTDIRPWFPQTLDECLCHKGKVLTEDFRVESNKLCIGGDNYMWGFSRSLIFVGLVLETVWCYVCLILLLLVTQKSELVRHGRQTVGVIRAILDLSEALNRALGPDTTWKTEKQLQKRISGHGQVGYTVWDKGDRA
ncbi:hypothetical protein OQA88_3 [Cercophora sp. LCS_1]